MKAIVLCVIRKRFVKGTFNCDIVFMDPYPCPHLIKRESSGLLMDPYPCPYLIKKESSGPFLSENYSNCLFQHYSAVMRYISQGPMLLDVHMHRPHSNSRNFMDALLAFWPGLQVSCLFKFYF